MARAFGSMMPGVQGRGSRFAGVENRGLQRLTHDEASSRVQSTACERSLHHKGRINGVAEWVPPLGGTAYEPDLPLRVSRRSRSLATLHSQPDAAERGEPTFGTPQAKLQTCRIPSMRPLRRTSHVARRTSRWKLEAGSWKLKAGSLPYLYPLI